MPMACVLCHVLSFIMCKTLCAYHDHGSIASPMFSVLMTYNVANMLSSFIYSQVYQDYHPGCSICSSLS